MATSSTGTPNLPIDDGAHSLVVSFGGPLWPEFGVLQGFQAPFVSVKQGASRDRTVPEGCSEDSRGFNFPSCT